MINIVVIAIAVWCFVEAQIRAFDNKVMRGQIVFLMRENTSMKVEISKLKKDLESKKNGRVQ